MSCHSPDGVGMTCDHLLRAGNTNCGWVRHVAGASLVGRCAGPRDAFPGDSGMLWNCHGGCVSDNSVRCPHGRIDVCQPQPRSGRESPWSTS